MRVIQLTNLPGDYGDLAFSPIGEQIAFVLDGENPVRGDLYVQLVGSDRPLRLTHTRSGFVCCGDWSPDGREIPCPAGRVTAWRFISHPTEPETGKWRRELSTGQETQVTRHGGFAAFESYDAKTLYYSRFEGGGIWSRPQAGAKRCTITDALHRGYWGHFAVTDAGIYFLDSDAEPAPQSCITTFKHAGSHPFSL